MAMSLESCRTSSYDKNMKKIDDRKAVKAKETQAQYDAALDRHRSIQTKDTRKQMKKHSKASKDTRFRLFGKKERIGCGTAK
jgi:predicted metalloprotease